MKSFPMQPYQILPDVETEEQQTQGGYQQSAGQEGQKEPAGTWIVYTFMAIPLLALCRLMVIVTYWLKSPQRQAVKRSGRKDKFYAFCAYAYTFPWGPSALRALWKSYKQTAAQQDTGIILEDVAPVANNTPNDETPPEETQPEAIQPEATSAAPEIDSTDPTPPEPSNVGPASSEHHKEGDASNQESTDG